MNDAANGPPKEMDSALIHFSHFFSMQSERLGLIMIGLSGSHATVAANQFGFSFELRGIYDAATWVSGKVNKILLFWKWKKKELMKRLLTVNYLFACPMEQTPPKLLRL